MQPEGILYDWNLGDLTTDEVAKRAQKIIEDVTRVYDQVGALKPEDISYENCIKPLIDIECVQSTEENPIDFIQHAVPDKALRDASVEASKKLHQLSVEMSMRKDVFANICLFKEKVGLEGLTHEQKRFVEKEIIDGKRNGLHLDDAQREEIKALKNKIADLGTDFKSNLNEDTSFVELTEAELSGVPEDLIKTLEKTESGKLKLTMQYPHFFPVTRKCNIPETRRRVEQVYQSRCLEANTKILEQLISLRHELAQKLGYKNHAAYVQELRMAKTPENVAKFNADLAQKLQPIWKKELQEMLELKEADAKKHGYEFNGRLDFWDFRYFMTQIEAQRYSVDQEKLKEYFPMEKVTQGLLAIYQELLGLKFSECAGVKLWHPDVTLFKVQDAESLEILGYFFLDMHPRDGKYGHAAVFSLQPSCIDPNGKRQPGVCAMMANFSKSTADKPSLLDHGEVTTFFHEFGHLMHGLCSRTSTTRFQGLHVERDFVEAPSQMLENWCWHEEPLQRMSGHYKDGSPIPKELLSKLIDSRLANAGGFNLRQIILSTSDQRFHTSGQVDTTKVFGDTYKEILGIDIMPGTNMPASWGHMVGYDAQYYGYMWSEVFSMDMFQTRFVAEGLMNPSVGKDYRTKILEQGGSKDAVDLLKEFLGREPNDEAFLRSKGLGK